jgi:hypothetical protein
MHKHRRSLQLFDLIKLNPWLLELRVVTSSGGCDLLYGGKSSSQELFKIFEIILENWKMQLVKYFANSFVTVQEHFIACCRCKVVVQLFGFLQSPHSLHNTCGNVWNSTFH